MSPKTSPAAADDARVAKVRRKWRQKGFAMADVKATWDRVRQMLARMFDGIEVDRDGDFTFRNGSARVFVSVEEAFREHTVVNVRAITNMQVPPSPDLFRYIATNNQYTFGALRAVETDDGVMVSFRHTILGDTLDPEELMTAFATVAVTADDVDDEIQQRFGGARFHEDD
jgi:hypothetical protein